MSFLPFKLGFRRIPKLAIYCYATGFIIIMLAYIAWTNKIFYFSAVTIQQIFIVGAIIVAIGSVINTYAQINFRKKNQKD